MGGTEDTESETRSRVEDLPTFPGDNALSHDATKWREAAEARFTLCGMLAVAMGLPSPRIKRIVDYDLSMVPELDPSHRDAQRRIELRTSYIAKNASNAVQRQLIQLEDWTKVWAMLKKCTETSAPLLSKSLLDRCDLSKTYGPGRPCHCSSRAR